MEIKINGNRRLYQPTVESENIDLVLEGDFSFTARTPVHFLYRNQKVIFDSRHDLFQFTEDIKGKSTEYLVTSLVSQRSTANTLIQAHLLSASQIELELIKALFLIYNWTELPFTDPVELQFDKQIYNDFIIDYTGKEGAQLEIYFIDKKYKEEEYLRFINRLIGLNLLASAIFKTSQQEFQTYFTPLIKPGVPREYFKSSSDPTGEKTYTFWRNIINERNVRVRYWMKNSM